MVDAGCFRRYSYEHALHDVSRSEAEQKLLHFIGRHRN